MTVIIIKRPPNVNKAKDYEIYIDQQKAGIIADGEIIEFNRTNGQHTINLKVGQHSSPDIVIETSEDKITVLKVVGFKHIKWIQGIIFGTIALHLILKMTINFRYTTFLVLPVFLFYIYYQTRGWKKYLTLEEEV